MKMMMVECLLSVTIPICVLAHSVSYTLHVEDFESGQSLHDMPCETIFTTHTGDWNDMSRGHLEKGVTDADGDFKFKGVSDISHVTFSIRTEGDMYYPVIRKRLEFNGISGWLNKCWEPYDTIVTVRLQRVEHPIPLCVKNVRPKVAPGTFDGTNAVLRYDFVLGDWLPPEGKGERADLEIRTKLTINEVLQVGRRRKKVFFEFRNEIEFLGEGNGCCAEMTAPAMGIKLRNAPEVGYGKTIVNRFGVKRKIVGPNVNEAEYSDSNPNRCYYFRIRSRFDDKGNLVEAYYGKIYGDFNFHGDWSYGFQGFDFLCYLNPTSLDRNLEWDMKTNLCPNPGSLGQLQP